MAEQVVDTPAARLDEEFLTDFSARWHAAWNSHDAREVIALCTDDVEWLDPSTTGPQRGSAAVAASMEPLVQAFPDFRFEETEPAYPAVARRKAIAPWRFTGTMTGPLDPPGFAPTGRVVEFHGDDHLEFRGDLVCRCEALFDLNGIAVAIGAAPPPGSPGERLTVLLQRGIVALQRGRAGRRGG